MVEFSRKSITRLGKKIMIIWIRLATNRYFRQRFQDFYNIHPEYRRPVDPSIEKKHIMLWQVIRKNVNLNTLRLCANISGKTNSLIVPEDVFNSDIQRILCWQQEKIHYLENKSFYNRWYPGNIFPQCFIHNIDGSLFNSQYVPIAENELDNLLNNLEYPIVIKPNMDSAGGANVKFPKNAEELRHLIIGNKNYVVQEKIQQDEFFNKFNRYGLNTIRVNLYRSVITNEIHYLNASLRMGRGGSLDNITSGGIQCFINENGYLNDYAVDVMCNKFDRHPDTNIKFSDVIQIPKYEEMKSLAIRVARDMYLSRLISLDLCFDINKQWRVIEINLNDCAIEFAQFAGEPFFGPFTEEVINYCRHNPWWKL